MKFSDIISGCLNVFPVDFLSPRHPPPAETRHCCKTGIPCMHSETTQTRHFRGKSHPNDGHSKRPPKKRTEDSRIGTWNESTKNTHHDLLIHLSCFAPFPFTSETGTGASISSTDRADDPQCALIRKASHEPRIFNKTIHTLPTSH